MAPMLGQLGKRFLGSSRGTLHTSTSGRIHAESLPHQKISHHHRFIDGSDPDDWWGASLGIGASARSNERTGEQKRSDRSREDHFHHESDFWYFYHARYDAQQSRTKTYYYHEYHYMNYHSAHRGRQRSHHVMDVCHPENSIEMASKAFELALKAAERDMHGGCMGDTKELEDTITREIEKVAQYCGSDVISFARVIGVLDSESISKIPRDALVRKARKSIVFTFHPDKVNHLKESGKLLSYLLGQSILQALSTMPSGR